MILAALSKHRRWLYGALVLCLIPTVALAQDELAATDYTIGPKDLLEIRVLEIPELNVERRVSETGTVDLPLIGPFAINGMTVREAGDRLASVLMTKYVNRANVSVVVKDFANKPLSIVGAVARPGSLNITGRYTLLQAISAAGGLTQQAGKKIFIMRSAENGLSDVLEIRSDDLFRSSTARWNVPVFPSDVVNVPAKTTVTVFCMGEVKEPGALQFDTDDRITLLSVIAKSGGLTDRASKHIRVKRRGPDGRDAELTFNYNQILSRGAADPLLQADDVVIVKESFF